MNYCIRCSRVLVDKINFKDARSAQMDSGHEIYFCDRCSKLIDDGFFQSLSNTDLLT